MTPDADAEVGEEPATDGARRDACGRLARGGALENVARIAAIVLEHPDEIGVTGARTRDRPLARRRVVRAGGRVHDLLPVLPVAVANQHRDGRAKGLTRADAREKLDGVGLDLHPTSASISLLPARELRIHVLIEHWNAGRHPLEDADQRRSV
jgi:hypothetical protein